MHPPPSQENFCECTKLFYCRFVLFVYEPILSFFNSQSSKFNSKTNGEGFIYIDILEEDAKSASNIYLWRNRQTFKKYLISLFQITFRCKNFIFYNHDDSSMFRLGISVIVHLIFTKKIFILLLFLWWFLDFKQSNWTNVLLPTLSYI